MAAAIGDKIVETSAPLPCHLLSKLGCLLFSISSSNIGTTLHGGDGGGKVIFPPFEVSTGLLIGRGEKSQISRDF